MELHIPQLTIATAITFFHRFFTKYSFSDKEGECTGFACLFLAGKVEGPPTKLKELIAVILKYQYQRQFALDSPEFRQLKERILRYERDVLRVIGFDFQVEHPYSHLLSRVRNLEYDNHRQLAQLAWNFINDSLRTTLCVQYEPSDIAATAIYLASQVLKKPLTKGTSGEDWLVVLDCSLETIHKISNQILDLYDQGDKKDPNAPKPNETSQKKEGATN